MRRLLLAVQFPPAAVVALVLRLLSPVITVRLGELRAERLGHLALEPELLLCRRDAGLEPTRTIDVVHVSQPVCNQQLVDMWRRVLPMPPFAKTVHRVSRRLPGAARHEVPWVAEDHEGLLRRVPPHLWFTPAELARGSQERMRLGIDEGCEHVCVIARDKSYLSTALPAHDWSYHDYRDADIRNYEAAARELARRGHAVLRMGAVVATTFDVDESQVIDYASRARSDFLDVYLFATCRFALCSSSGPSTLALLFRRPLALANVAPILTVAQPPVGQLFIPKAYRSASDGAPLTAGDIRRLGAENLSAKEEFTARGIVLEENAPEEIAELAVEMDERVAGRWRQTSEDEEIQQRFWTAIGQPAVPEQSGLRIGSGFLRRHPELLES